MPQLQPMAFQYALLWSVLRTSSWVPIVQMLSQL